MTRRVCTVPAWAGSGTGCAGRSARTAGRPAETNWCGTAGRRNGSAPPGTTLLYGNWGRGLGSYDGACRVGGGSGNLYRNWYILGDYTYLNYPIGGSTGNTPLPFRPNNNVLDIPWTKPVVKSDHGCPPFKTTKLLAGRALVSDGIMHSESTPTAPGVGVFAHGEGYNVLYGDGGCAWYGDSTERIAWWGDEINNTRHYSLAGNMNMPLVHNLFNQLRDIDR